MHPNSASFEHKAPVSGGVRTGELVRIPFHGDDLLAIMDDGKPQIVLKHVVDMIGLDYWAQVERLRKHSWAALAKRQVQASGQVQRREMLVCNVRTFLMWLATVDENRVAEDVRPKLVVYQAEVADAIEAYFTQGGAINPRATDHQLATIIDRAKRQAEVLRVLTGIVDPAWLESKARHLAARALGEEPEDDLARRPITVGEYLDEQHVAASVARKLAPKFGKALKALFIARHGEQPGTTRRFVDGAQRNVAVYTEADRDLFDAVWTRFATGTAA